MESTSWRTTLWRRGRISLLFLLGLIGLDLVVHAFRSTWRRYDPDEYRERVRACRDGAWDLVVFGGSPVHEGIDPALLRGVSWRGTPLRRVFNCGLEGATASDTCLAVEQGLTTPPRLLVYGITASDVNDARGEPHGPRMLMGPADLATAWQLRPQATEWTTRHWLIGRASRSWNLYHYRHGIRLWLADQFPSFAPETAAEVQNNLRISTAIATNSGYAPRPEMRVRRLDRLKSRGWTGMPFKFLASYRLGGHFRYVERILDWAETHGTTAVLVDMPVSADLEEIHFASDFQSYRQALRGLAASRDVRVVWATRQAIGLTDADFADLIHLNAVGSKRFSTWLRAQIEGWQTSEVLKTSEVLVATGDQP